MKELRNNFREKLIPPVTFPKQSDSVTLFIIITKNSMKFELFLTKCHKIYNISEEEVDPMEEDAEIRSIFKFVEQSDLQKSSKALNYHMTTDPSRKVSYSTTSNHLITAIYEVPEYVYRNRSVSDVST